MKLEKTYLAMAKAGIFPELPDFLKTLYSDEYMQESNASEYKHELTLHQKKEI